MAKSQELNKHMGVLLEENKLLQAKADAAEQQAASMERLNQVYKETMEAYIQKAEAGLSAASGQKKVRPHLAWMQYTNGAVMCVLMPVQGACLCMCGHDDFNKLTHQFCSRWLAPAYVAEFLHGPVYLYQLNFCPWIVQQNLLPYAGVVTCIALRCTACS